MKERIRIIRKELGLTQEEFAKRIGLARNSVASYEIGRREPTNAIIVSICKEFHINEEWLRTGNGEMYSIQEDDYTKIAVDIDKNDPKARKVIIDYWNLSPKDKELFWNFFEKFVKKDGGN